MIFLKEKIRLFQTIANSRNQLFFWEHNFSSVWFLILLLRTRCRPTPCRTNRFPSLLSSIQFFCSSCYNCFRSAKYERVQGPTSFSLPLLSVTVQNRRTARLRELRKCSNKARWLRALIILDPYRNFNSLPNEWILFHLAFLAFFKRVTYDAIASMYVPRWSAPTPRPSPSGWPNKATRTHWQDTNLSRIKILFPIDCRANGHRRKWWYHNWLS